MLRRQATSILSVLLIVNMFSFVLFIQKAKSIGGTFSDEFNNPTSDSRWITVDPDGGSTFDLNIDPGWLRMSTISPPARDLTVSQTNAPRLVQSISGNFTVETKISSVADENDEGAGLLVWKDAANFLRLETIYRYGDHQVFFCGTIEGSSPIPGETQITLSTDVNPIYLRLARRSNVFSGSYSTDGISWNHVADVVFPDGDPIQIGLDAIVAYHAGVFSADFDYFRSVIIVPDDYSTIQEAIDNANAGDTIHVRGGIYRENIVVTKSLRLFGENPESTTIDGLERGVVVQVSADDVIISGFTISGSNHSWIPVEGACGVRVGGNYPSPPSRCEISNNRITSNEFGIAAWGFSHRIFENNIYANVEEGLWMWAEGSAFDVFGNNVTDNGGIGIDVRASGSNIHGNYLSNNSHGIALMNCYSNNVFRNRVAACRDSGIWVSGYSGSAYNNAIFENNIDNRGTNNGNNLRFDVANGNYIYHNNVVGDTIRIDIAMSTGITWDDRYPSGGNYWSDYNGTDSFLGPDQNEIGSDGIGDTPYIIDEDNVDHYPLSNPWAPPDVAVLNVSFSKTILGQGFALNFSALFENQGDKIEEFNITFCANDTLICQQSFMLRSGNAVIYSNIFNTSDVSKGNYSLAVGVEPLEGETDLTDNYLSDRWVFITIPGDLNGDKTVDIYDAILLGGCFTSHPASPHWNPNIDINGDNIVDIYDAIILADHYNEHYI